MTIKLNDGRQSSKWAIVDINLTDLDGTNQHAIELAGGAIVLRGELFVSEAFNAGTTATLKVGDAADDDRYTGTPLDLKTAGRKQLVPTGYVMPQQGYLTVSFAQTGTVASTGKARLCVEYIAKGRVESTQG